MFASDIHKRIEKEFEAAAPSVAQELEKFIESFRAVSGTHPGDRVIRCIVHLAEGKQANVGRYIKAALGDPRDVMFWAEYDRDEERINDFSMPFTDVV